ncbi:hypothetical protein LP419_11810 [Massilia sp. H-1]|nr:hypothetical protein LP419_11810 [Massilia sp. H-1]
MGMTGSSKPQKAGVNAKPPSAPRLPGQFGAADHVQGGVDDVEGALHLA